MENTVQDSQVVNRLHNTFTKLSQYVYLEENGPVDNLLSIPIIFTLLVLFQGCFGANGIVVHPSFLTSTIHGFAISPLIRFLFVMSIAYTASNHIVMAFIGTVIFFIFLHLIRTREEREQAGFYF